MFEEKSAGEQIADMVLIAILLYVTVQLFKRRLGWFAEKLVGFVFFFLAGFTAVYVAGLNSGAVTTNYMGNDHWAPFWSGGMEVAAIAAGTLWVLYSLATWPEAHRVAMLKWEAQKRARKQARVEAVAAFRRDYGI